MKGKSCFTQHEINQLRILIKERCKAPSNKQKGIRAKMRRIGFYGGDDFGISDMTVEKFEGLIQSKRITIGDAKQNEKTGEEYQSQVPEEAEVVKESEADKAKQSLPPLIDENAEILVLGTMPGDASLEMRQYYASSNNSFWKIVDKLWNESKGFKNYQEKEACLKQHHVALWDVLARCEREGSSDSSIQKGQMNDMEELLKQYPNVKKIVFNGKKAAEYYNPSLDFAIAKSTSSANTIPFDEKFADWKDKLNAR